MEIISTLLIGFVSGQMKVQQATVPFSHDIEIEVRNNKNYEIISAKDDSML
jgi:hypothetical protein